MDIFRFRGSNSVVECHLAKVDVASSNLVSRSNFSQQFQIVALPAFTDRNGTFSKKYT